MSDKAKSAGFRNQYVRAPGRAREGVFVRSTVCAQARAREGAQPERSIEVAERICEFIAGGARLHDAATALGFPSWQPVYEWLLDDATFKKQYRDARRKGRARGKLSRDVAAFLAAAKAREVDNGRQKAGAPARVAKAQNATRR